MALSVPAASGDKPFTAFRVGNWPLAPNLDLGDSSDLNLGIAVHSGAWVWGRVAKEGTRVGFGGVG